MRGRRTLERLRFPDLQAGRPSAQPSPRPSYIATCRPTNDGMIGALFGGLIAASAVLGKDVTADILARSRPDLKGI